MTADGFCIVQESPAFFVSVLQVKHALRGSHFAVLRAETKYRNSEVATYAYKFITGFSSGNAAQPGISENQASRAAGNAGDGHDIGAICLKHAGWIYSGYFGGFASDCADHYPDARRSVPGHSGFKKGRAPGRAHVLCTGLF